MHARTWKAVARKVAACVILCSAAFLPGCHPDAGDDEMLSQAWGHSEAKEFAAAFPLVRDYIARHPRNPAAHYLLGKCFVNRTPPELTRAKGEFDTARFLCESGDFSGVPGIDVPQEAFLAANHYETALTLLLTAIEANKAGITLRASLGILRTALDHTNRGLQMNPASSPLAELRSTLEDAIRQAAGNGTPYPYAPGANRVS